MSLIFFFFFSSRRRHTRLTCDWSSDVCSSDLARQLAAAGFQTVILDKKKVVGEPVQCAEGVSEFGPESNGLRPREAWIAQRVSGAKCVAPNGNWFYITRLPGYAIDRPAFDRWIVEGAVDDGADLRT